MYDSNSSGLLIPTTTTTTLCEILTTLTVLFRSSFTLSNYSVSTVYMHYINLAVRIKRRGNTNYDAKEVLYITQINSIN